jgi:predicted hotdog family 3-hydroxylacyl-ACP dehydratase
MIAKTNMLAKQDWKHLLPHRGAMCLLDAVVAWDDSSIHAGAASHRDPHNVLRSDSILRSVHLCEYGAQAMAIHGGLLGQRDDRAAAPGLLVSLRAVKLHVARIDDLPHKLDVYAQKLLDSGSSWQYEFRIEHRAQLLAQGRAAVISGSY